MSDVDGWVRGSCEGVCEVFGPAFEVDVGVDVDGRAAFAEVLIKVFNTAALNESFSTPDLRSRTS